MLNHTQLTGSLLVKDSIMKHGGTIIVQPTRAYVEVITKEDVNGMDDDSISKIPVVEYNHPTQDACSICLEQFDPGDLVRLLKCGHIFHPSCVRDWLKKEATCPMCRKQQEPRMSKENISNLVDLLSNMVMYDNRYYN
jgi:hypothetical protein